MAALRSGRRDSAAASPAETAVAARARASFRTWLLAIARNRCLNSLEKRRPLLTDFSGPESHPADLRSPDEGLEQAELYRRLDEALGALPFEQRTAFVLAELEGLP